MLCLASDWFECSREGRFGVQSELLAESGSQGVMVGHRVLHMDFFSVDASLLTGTNVWLFGAYFVVTWDDAGRWTHD